jgi:hypothetical protein
VSACSDEDQIVSSAAYILFYARRGVDFGNLDYERVKSKTVLLESSSGATKELAGETQS